jgi:hypothetical protein
MLLSWKPFFGIRGISLLRSHLSQRNGLQNFFCAKCHSACPLSYQPSALGSTFNRCKQASKHHPNETMNPATTLLLCLLGTTEKTRSAGSDKTGLLTLDGVSGDGRSLTNMLMVTTTVRMVDGVHGNTTSLGPAVTLDSELVLGTRSLEEGLVSSATTSDNTDHSSGSGVDDLLGARGELDAGLALIRVVADNGDVVAGGSAESATITDLLLDVGDDGTLRHLTEGEDVADGQSSLLSGIDELAGVHAFVGDEGLGSLLESVGVAEDDLGERGTTTSIVDDLADYTSKVAVALGIIEVSELGRSLVQARVGREDGSTTLTLVANNSTHRE